jgi:hypothetical protein
MTCFEAPGLERCFFKSCGHEFRKSSHLTCEDLKRAAHEVSTYQNDHQKCLLRARLFCGFGGGSGAVPTTIWINRVFDFSEPHLSECGFFVSPRITPDA